MNRAFMFPGQGSQTVGMGQDLYNSVRFIRELVDKASHFLEIDLPKYMFYGPKEKLDESVVAQAALFVMSTSLSKYLIERNNIKPSFVIGHSLGEYSALVSAGILTWEDGLNIIKYRSKAMLKAGKKQPGAMAAIIGISVENIENICKEVSLKYGDVIVANYNCNLQSVISGTSQAVEKVTEISRRNGAIADKINVDGACHSDLMKEAQNEIIDVIKNTSFHDTMIPIISSISGDSITDIEKYKALLLKQITRPVYWEKVVNNCLKRGVDQFIELGSGKILNSLVRGIDRKANVASISDNSALEGFLGNVNIQQ
ncbi:ACP S-malonyltransferase [Salipaludibacillus agaradhaerens]|uniref:ACP S-malonyltransferase n=1 Tax=Salipaludibacillus agaradhaerens TaxID=76935 RepID=UPI002151DD7B|nr:ACP S-malonyltransferase [Salipaludibacillus agaradhaerens]MCR6105810.1 ACP S-malonyltransferase [Salipaludibacillus agaradhaerens]MCR6117846.1 ACP S-malonyltransferase [Salipaludibacillus agaradhaerens]